MEEIRKMNDVINKYKNMTTEEYFGGNQFSIDAFNKKYRQGDETYSDAVKRVCDFISSVETTEELRKYWSARWQMEILSDWWHPAGSIMQGAGSGRKISLANCTHISAGGLDNLSWDSLEGIFRNFGYTVAKTAAYRQGLGVDFSRLRPRGSKIMNSSNESTGAIHWMKLIDSIGYFVGQKGRIPAMLFSLNIKHPDIEEFITVKKDYTMIQNANISVQVTDEFYKAVLEDKDWELVFTIPQVKKGDKVYVDIHSALMDHEKDENGYYYTAKFNKEKEVIKKTISAKKLFRLIAENMWKNAEPGIQNIDVARKYSNSDAVYNESAEYDSRIIGTNACSEQYMSRDSLCVLSSIFMSSFSIYPEQYKEELKTVAYSINRFLDDVNECELVYGTYATPFQKMAIENLRRTGAGITDLGGWVFKMNLEYGDEDANNKVEEFAKWYNYYLYESTISLGKEKGSFKLFDPDRIKKSKFIQHMNKEFPELKFDAMRNVTVSSVAPTGTLTLMKRTATMSYGIEPAFGMYFWKRTRITGKYKYYFVVPNEVRMLFKERGLELPMEADMIEDTWDGKRGSPIAKFIEENKEKIEIRFKTSTEISPMKKMDLMAKVMKWIDSSISVTYMLPENTKIHDVENFLLEGWKRGVKSIATFPDKKMYGIVSFIPFRESAMKLKSEGVSLHPQNFDDDELKELNLSRDSITPAFAPARPRILDADVFTIQVKDERFLLAIGLLNGVPYEMFGGKMNGLKFSFGKEKSGIIEKVKRSQYKLVIANEIIIDDFSEQFEPVEKALFRMVSTGLRHGVPIRFIVEQLSKSVEEMHSLTAAAARVLKKYIKDGESVSGMSCPSCNNTNLIYENGCVKCSFCGWSRCI